MSQLKFTLFMHHFIGQNFSESTLSLCTSECSGTFGFFPCQYLEADRPFKLAQLFLGKLKFSMSKLKFTLRDRNFLNLRSLCALPNIREHLGFFPSNILKQTGPLNLHRESVGILGKLEF